MKKGFFLAVAVGLLAGCAVSAYAANELEILVDPDGTTYLHNTTGGPVSFDGYQIVSHSKNQLDVAGWDSISDRVPARLAELFAQLGTGAVTFGEAAPTEAQLAELNLPGVGTLEGGAKFNLGKPFKTYQNDQQLKAEYDFFFSLGPSAPNNEGEISLIPEPSTFVLGGLGLVGLLGLIRRRRAA
jgi:hypothetical protein